MALTTTTEEHAYVPCGKDGCTLKPVRKGLCWSHWRRSLGKFCSLPGCASIAHGKGLCRTHRRRQQLGEPDWNRPVTSYSRVVGGKKVCTCVRLDPWAFKALGQEAKKRGLPIGRLYAYVLEGWARDNAIDDTDEAELGPAAVSSGADFKKVAVVRAYADGDMSVLEIAAEFGVSDRYVYRAIEAAGVPTRQEKH